MGVLSFFKRAPTDEDLREYQAKRLPVLDPPPREEIFWDVPALLVLSFFVLAVFALWLYFKEQTAFLAAGGPGFIQGDTSQTTLVDAATQVTAAGIDAATQTTELVDNATQTSLFLLDETFVSDSFDYWVPPTEPAAVVASYLPVLGPNTTFFVGLPWGWAALGGATVGGVLFLWPYFSSFRRFRRRPLAAAAAVLGLPLVLLGGAVAGVFFLYVGGRLTGTIAPFRVLQRESVVYLLDFFVPGVRNGRFSVTALFVDLTATRRDGVDLFAFVGFLTVRRPSRWWFTRGVALVGVLLLAEHFYRGLTVTTDVERYGRLLAQNVQNLEEMHRIAHERHVWFIEHPPTHLGVKQDVQMINERLLQVTGISRTNQVNDYKAQQLAESYLLEHSARLVKTPSLLERAFDQAARLVRR